MLKAFIETIKFIKKHGWYGANRYLDWKDEL